MTLPDVDHDQYWALHRQPDATQLWEAGLDLIGAETDLDLSGMRRSPYGRNVVFLNRSTVVKLIPPFWTHMGVRERLALEWAVQKLAIPTPELLHHGSIAAWSYLVMSRVPGLPAGRRGDHDPSIDPLHLAYWQGQTAAALHHQEPLPGLDPGWVDRIGEQREELDLSELPMVLARTAEAYVDEAGDLTAPPHNLLHGDLASVNVIVGPDGGYALIDWSDAMNGPRSHDLISPFMHQFRGDVASIDRFWAGYGSPNERRITAHEAMARSILKYATLLPGYLADLPGSMPESWPEAAARFFRIRA